MIYKKELDFCHIINNTSRDNNHINNNQNDITNKNNIYNNINNNKNNNNNLKSNESNQEEELSISSLNLYEDEESLNSIGIDEDMINRFPKNIIDHINKLQDKNSVIFLEDFKNGDETTTVLIFIYFIQIV